MYSTFYCISFFPSRILKTRGAGHNKLTPQQTPTADQYKPSYEEFLTLYFMRRHSWCPHLLFQSLWVLGLNKNAEGEKHCNRTIFFSTTPRKRSLIKLNTILTMVLFWILSSSLHNVSNINHIEDECCDTLALGGATILTFAFCSQRTQRNAPSMGIPIHCRMHFAYTVYVIQMIIIRKAMRHWDETMTSSAEDED